MKIPARLQPLVDEGLVDEVIRPLMSGKEAAVYLVRSNGRVFVAKVYKEVKHRSFRQRAGYTEGRKVRNSRQQRAMEKGSKYGREQAEEQWHNAEVDALYRLAHAGVRVPAPHLFTDGVLLMDLVADAAGDPAPRLWDVELTEAEAVEVHRVLVHQAVLMLCAGMVHGDLSEYNVLFAADGPTIIDLPQATEAAVNPNARRLFVRDLDGLTRFLARFAPALAETRYGEEIWDLYERARLTPDTPLTGRWKGSNRKADTRAVLAEIADAEEEHRRKVARDGGDRGGRSRGAPEAPPPKRPAAPPRRPPPATAGPTRPAPAPPRPAPAAKRPADIDLDRLDALLLEE